MGSLTGLVQISSFLLEDADILTLLGVQKRKKIDWLFVGNRPVEDSKRLGQI